MSFVNTDPGVSNQVSCHRYVGSLASQKNLGPAWLSGKVFDLQSRGPGFEPHWILWVFRGSVLGQDTSEPSLVLVKPRKDMNDIYIELSP